MSIPRDEDLVLELIEIIKKNHFKVLSLSLSSRFNLDFVRTWGILNPMSIAIKSYFQLKMLHSEFSQY